MKMMKLDVEHSFVTFNDGNTEAVMGVYYNYKDGKVISYMETGATKIT